MATIIRQWRGAFGVLTLVFAACHVAWAAPSAAKMNFPEGTATASEVCGACHKAVYLEFAKGSGGDMRWRGAKLLAGTPVLELPGGVSRSATAHAIAGADPWPLAARDHEEKGRACNVCHYPQPLDYPDLASAKIEKPKPRATNPERGVTCASCHLTPDGKIRGPYGSDAPHETVADPRIRTSVACAYCHSDGERVVGKQTQTFLEWREDFFKPKLGSQHCQDCHMPRTVRKLAEDFDVPPRSVARHLVTGGHSLQRLRSALNLSIVPATPPDRGFAFHVTNVGAGHSVPTGSNRRAVYLVAELLDADGKVIAAKEWMFAPWFANRPDDRKYVEEDKQGPEPIAQTQADAQGPHETIIRAGEDRVLTWNPDLPAGRYAIQATLIHDLNRYNDRAYKDDQDELARVIFPVPAAPSARYPDEAQPSAKAAHSIGVARR